MRLRLRAAMTALRACEVRGSDADIIGAQRHHQAEGHHPS
jgi:hypothetical protein